MAKASNRKNRHSVSLIDTPAQTRNFASRAMADPADDVELALANVLLGSGEGLEAVVSV